MKRILRTLVGAFAVIGIVATASLFTGTALAQHQASQIAVAKISPVQAMHAAEGKVGGKASIAIYEFDEGHWIYGVVVAKNHKLMEVDVDPVSGKAGATEDVTPADEAKEFQDALAKIQKSAN